jgi:uracil-DNA glycosylase family 4
MKKRRDRKGMDSKNFDFLQAVYSLLCYHRAIGVDGYPAGSALSRFLREGNRLDRISGDILEKPWTGTVPASGLPPESIGKTVRDIVDEINSCTGCVLHTKRITPVPGGGSEQPRLLIVGGWLVGQEGVTIPPGCILGLEEDGMVSRMLSAMKLPPEKAFITNIIKCALPDTSRPSAEHIHTCFSLLLRQITVLAPEVICTLGIVATRALLRNSQPLSQLRGKFYPFAVSEGKSIPVIPTYHPTFLLQNPEFKRATWEDLQSIAKLLKTM